MERNRFVFWFSETLLIILSNRSHLLNVGNLERRFFGENSCLNSISVLLVSDLLVEERKTWIRW